MNEAVLAIAIADILPAIDPNATLADRARQAMEAAQNFWMDTDDDIRFAAACSALLRTANEEEKIAIGFEIKTLSSIAAAMRGVPVNFAEVANEAPEDFKPLGLADLFRKAKAAASSPKIKPDLPAPDKVTDQSSYDAP